MNVNKRPHVDVKTSIPDVLLNPNLLSLVLVHSTLGEVLTFYFSLIKPMIIKDDFKALENIFKALFNDRFQHIFDVNATLEEAMRICSEAFDTHNHISNKCRFITIEDVRETLDSNQFKDGLDVTFYGTMLTLEQKKLLLNQHIRVRVLLPDGVTTIEKEAFSRCGSIISVTFPDSFTTIGEDAFHDCTGLISVTFSDSLTSIGDYAFCSCHSLITVTFPDSLTTIGNSVFCECISLTSVTFPDSLTTIGRWAFCSCHSLTSVTFPDSLTTIGRSAFADCIRLISVTFPNSLTTIGSFAFSRCISLTSVTFPNSLTTIDMYAFGHCHSLISVTLPTHLSHPFPAGVEIFTTTG